MAKKVYTIKVDDENLKSTLESKSIKTKKSVAEKEVESFGIVEINNASSKCKVKNSKEAGFEKNVTNQAKKQIKSQVSQVEDYFDFSFRPVSVVKTEEKAEALQKKVAIKKDTKTTAAKATKKTSAKSKKVEDSTSVLKIDEDKVEEVRNTMIVAAVCDRIVMDDDAREVMSVARLGSLFG